MLVIRYKKALLSNDGPGLVKIRPRSLAGILGAVCLCFAATTVAQEGSSELESLKQEIEHQRIAIERQRAEIERQAEALNQRLSNLDALEQRLEAALSDTSQEHGAQQTALSENPEDSDGPEDLASTGAEFIADEPSLILTGEDLIDDEFPGSWPIFGTTTRMRIGGYIKVDALFDFDGNGNPDQFLLNEIAIDGSPEALRGGYFNAHARETRFNLDYRDTAPGKTPKQAFVEVDFFTPPDSSAVLRLRHAYVVYGDFLVGRSWTTLSELRALPFMIDFAFGDALFGGRTEQIRWQRPLSNGSVAVALENPSDNSIANPLDFTGRTSPRLPYFAARWSNDNPERLFTLGTQIQELRWDGEGGTPDDTAIGWGVIAAGRWHLNDRSYLTGTASYSDGFSDSILALAGGGGSAVITPNGLDTDKAITLSFGAAINWTDTLSSNFHYAWLDRSGNRSRPGTETESGGIGHVNLMWRLTDKARTGVEYVWGRRETLEGLSGDGSRLIGTFRYDLGVPYQ